MDRLVDIAIIGASAAGVTAATAMRRSGYAGTVTIYDQDTHLPYERPPLSKSLSRPGQELKPILPTTTYEKLAIELRLGVRVDALEPEKRLLVLSDGTTERYDRVLLATGVSARRLQLPGATLNHVLYLRNADDARALTGRLMVGGPLVVIGGGFIGLELAAVARSRGLEVTVVEAAPLPLAHAAGLEVASLLLALHTDHGVRFITSATVAAFRGSEAVEEVVLQDGRVLPARTVVVAVGVTANDHLARALELECVQGVIVDNAGATANPWLWAAGDVAVRQHRYLRQPCRIEHWDTAQRHGEAAGRSIVGKTTDESAVPYVWSDQYDLTYQAFGRPESGDHVVLREGAEPHHFLAFFTDDERVYAVGGIGHPREVRATRSLIESGVPVPARVLRDPGTDLRRLSRVG